MKSIFESDESKPSDSQMKARQMMSVVSPNFNEKREKANYKNYTCTYSIKNAHTERINCLCYLINGTILTGSNDKHIRLWSPLDPKPLGSLEEDYPITHMIRMGKTSQQDITVLYVATKVIRYLSIKQ